MMNKKSKVNSITTQYESDWLSLNKCHWEKHSGEKFSYEFVKRNKCSNIVMIIPRFKDSGDFVLVRQFRPPLNSYTLEFPAGLVDLGEDLETAALRELKEETGYSGLIIQRHPDRCVSAGLSSEVITAFEVEIDKNSTENKNPILDPDESEDIEVILMTKDDLYQQVHKSLSKDIIDVKLSLYCIGLFS